jgi:hypothetical protein
MTAHHSLPAWRVCQTHFNEFPNNEKLCSHTTADAAYASKKLQSYVSMLTVWRLKEPACCIAVKLPAMSNKQLVSARNPWLPGLHTKHSHLQCLLVLLHYEL